MAVKDIKLLKSKQKYVDESIKKIYDIEIPKFDSFATEGHKDHVKYVLFKLKEKIEENMAKVDKTTVLNIQ